MSFTEYYNSFKTNPNNFSNWFPKVEHCGIKVPKSIIISVPEEVAYAYFMEHQDKDIQTVMAWVKEYLMPLTKEVVGQSPYIFIKNGTFSDKFTFSNCRCRSTFPEITMSIIDINYASLMFGAAGISEIILREYIPANPAKTVCIYNGMPLRPEFRCFYDFDQRKLLYSKNYWDWDYCHEAIGRDATDKFVYEHAYPYIEAEYGKRLPEVEKMVSDHMKNVDLTGIWSVDILYNEADDTYYLIDMAIAEQSAYWDPEKANQ